MKCAAAAMGGLLLLSVLPARQTTTTQQKKQVKKKVTAAKATSSSKSSAKFARSTRKTVAAKPRPVPLSAEVREAAFRNVSGSMDEYPDTFDNSFGLVPFFERLYRMKDESPSLHVLHYGDSHSASDDWPHTLRTAFQEKFGNGGPGFSMPGSPYRGYRRFDLRSWNSRFWTTEGTPLRLGDGLHGLGGVSLTARHAGEVVSLSVEGDHAELLFLQQPGGGQFDVYLDNEYQATVDTNGQLGPASLELPAVSGPHTYQFRTRTSDVVRLLGSVVQNNAGMTWETLGINGAQVAQVLDWDPRLLSTHMAKRDPAMIVLAYGTNEANGPNWNPQAYFDSLRRVVQIFRRLAPSATILMIGPPDCRVRSQTALSEVIDIQRQVAAEFGCAFWNWRARMGGPGAIRNWVYAGMAQGDYVHMTPAGYQLTGKTLYRDLMQQYARFLRVRTETASVTTRQGN